WQLSNRINTPEEFEQVIPLTDSERKALSAAHLFRVDITPYFISLIDPDDPTPYVVVPDSRGRVRCHHVFRKQPYIKDVIVLVSEITPSDYIEYLGDRGYDHIVCGKDHVDYGGALSILNERYGIESVRSDSGEILNSILLKEGLADEISLMITPVLAGMKNRRLFGRLDMEENVQLELLECRELDNGLILVRYHVERLS
ncbi:MAG: dihydrofolate reductase family protein, partial [Thermoplasmatota archaeon]